MHTRKIGERTGQLLIRGEPIPEGLYHIVVEVLAVHQDGSVLLTRRDYNKGGYPGFGKAVRADNEEFTKNNSKEYVPLLIKGMRETVGRLFGENAAE